MTDEPVPPPVSEEMDQAEALALLGAMFAGKGAASPGQAAGPVLWKAMTAEDAESKWSELRVWVEELVQRFEHLDHHVIPLCWWRHNGHVEALVALRDHERLSYSNASAPSAAVDWHRAFRDVEARLREWTATLPCGSHHDSRARPARKVDEDEWAAFVAEDAALRPASQTPPAQPEADSQPPDQSPPYPEEL